MKGRSRSPRTLPRRCSTAGSSVGRTLAGSSRARCALRGPSRPGRRHDGPRGGARGPRWDLPGGDTHHRPLRMIRPVPPAPRMPTCPRGSRAHDSSAASASSRGWPARSRPPSTDASSTLLVSGSGGLGVSRLLDEAERRIAGLPEDLVVVRCRARPGRIGDPYAPVATGLETLVAEFDDRELARVAGIGAEELAKLLPATVDRLGAVGLLPARPTVTEPERRQTRMLESILGLLIRIGERTPVVLALEDLQSADAGNAGARHVPGPGLAARSVVRPRDLPARRADPQPSAPDRAGRDGRRHRRRRPSSPSSRSTETSSPSSSRASRASVRRRRSSSSSPSGRAGTRSSPRSSWPPGASSPAPR